MAGVTTGDEGVDADGAPMASSFDGDSVAATDCDRVMLDREVEAEDDDCPCAHELDASSEFSTVGDAVATGCAAMDVAAAFAAAAALSLMLHTLLAVSYTHLTLPTILRV